MEMALRRFLKRSKAATPDRSGKETHGLLVIDHHEAGHHQADQEVGVVIIPTFRGRKHSKAR